LHGNSTQETVIAYSAKLQMPSRQSTAVIFVSFIFGYPTVKYEKKTGREKKVLSMFRWMTVTLINT